MQERPPSPAPRIAWRVLTVIAGGYLLAISTLLVMAGENDDSPGLGGLGLGVGIIGLVMVVNACWGLVAPALRELRERRSTSI